MVSLEVGRVCMKVAGREAGKYCVVIKTFAKEKEKSAGSFVTVTGPRILTGVKRRRSNIEHVEALNHFVEIKEDASDEEVISAMEKAGLITKLGLKRPSAAEMKTEKTKEKTEEKVVEKKEEKPKKEKVKEEKKEEKKTKKK